MGAGPDTQHVMMCGGRTTHTGCEDVWGHTQDVRMGGGRTTHTGCEDGWGQDPHTQEGQNCFTYENELIGLLVNFWNNLFSIRYIQ